MSNFDHIWFVQFEDRSVKRWKSVDTKLCIRSFEFTLKDYLVFFKMASSDRFSVSRVNDRDSRDSRDSRDRREMAVDVSRNANTVPSSPDRRPSFNQLTR